MNVIEVAVYALVLTKASLPFTCAPHGADGASCSNGYSATVDGDKNIVFQDGVAIEKMPDGGLKFSNGINSYWGSMGWIQFSNGMSVRRDNRGVFRFNNGMACRSLPGDTVDCQPEASD
ncbi:MAG: hypothetical protein P4M00_10105 [Azospirillaceae bacterium]|nr:hypothetical protein [Azospirillaceae bacterium]